MCAGEGLVERSVEPGMRLVRPRSGMPRKPHQRDGETVLIAGTLLIVRAVTTSVILTILPAPQLAYAFASNGYERLVSGVLE